MQNIADLPDGLYYLALSKPGAFGLAVAVREGASYFEFDGKTFEIWPAAERRDLSKQEFADELKAFCLRCGFQLAGTCEWEGIYGEIRIVRIGEDPQWRDWDQNCFNFDWDDEKSP